MTSNKYVEEHITWLEANELLLVSGIKRKPKACDVKKAKKELRGIRAVLKKLRA